MYYLFKHKTVGKVVLESRYEFVSELLKNDNYQFIIKTDNYVKAIDYKNLLSKHTKKMSV